MLNIQVVPRIATRNEREMSVEEFAYDYDKQNWPPRRNTRQRVYQAAGNRVELCFISILWQAIADSER